MKSSQVINRLVSYVIGYLHIVILDALGWSNIYIVNICICIYIYKLIYTPASHFISIWLFAAQLCAVGSLIRQPCVWAVLARLAASLLPVYLPCRHFHFHFYFHFQFPFPCGCCAARVKCIWANDFQAFAVRLLQKVYDFELNKKINVL